MSKLENISSPIRIILDTTRKCNLFCWYCHSTSGPEYNGPEIAREDLPHIFEAAEKNRVLDITLTGGEPLLWSGLEGASEMSGDLVEPALQLITNATAINEHRLDILKRATIQRACVSLDGEEAVHERNRGEGTFQKTLKGIKQLQGLVDDITVVSVVDSTNYRRWPELTQMLVNIGVNQHHLSPVCFAGNAMYDYRGLTREQFLEVRFMVNEISPHLPRDFILRFNDLLITAVQHRTMSTASFTERHKGWHVIVRPDGSVRSSVKAWGRSWRDNETIGNIHDEPLTAILHDYPDKIQPILRKRFSAEEEKRRKFHLGNVTQDQIERDFIQVKRVEQGLNPCAHREAAAKVAEKDQDGIFKILEPGLIDSLTSALDANPGRYRLREEDGFGFFFDRRTFDVTLLSREEVAAISNRMPL